MEQTLCLMYVSCRAVLRNACRAIIVLLIHFLNRQNEIRYKCLQVKRIPSSCNLRCNGNTSAIYITILWHDSVDHEYVHLHVNLVWGRQAKVKAVCSLMERSVHV